MSDEGEQELIALARSGDRKAFAHVIARQQPALRRVAQALLPHGIAATTADDLVQDTWLAAYTKLSTYDAQKGSLRMWLIGILRNAARHAWRDAREVAVDPMTDTALFDLAQVGGWGGDPSDVATHKQDATQLASALAELSADDFTLLLLRDVEELSGVQVAELLGISVAAQKSRLHRARLAAMAAVTKRRGSVAEQERAVGGLRCRDVLGRLADYVAHELSASDEALVETHLRGCHVCEQFGGRYVQTVATIKTSLGVAPAAPHETVATILAQLGSA